MEPLPIVLGLVGLVLLVGGAELLVRGASRLAAAAGVSPLVVGLTVVAFGTSAPELAVSIGSSLTGQADLALGNVVGSNIFNTLFILGLSALVTPLVVDQKLVRVEVPLVIGVSVLVGLLALDGTIGRLDGLLLFGGVIVYTALAIRASRRESAAVEAEYREAEPGPGGSVLVQLLLVAVGLGLLVLGARWLVDGAVVVARTFGVTELVIGLTIVAGGTSLPEVATSVIAGLRGQRDIAVGNVVGSNLFNLLAVLGATAMVAPGGVAVPASALTFDVPVMIAAAIACLPIFFTGRTIARWEGGLFLAYYAAYVAYLILDATAHRFAPHLGDAVLYFVLPLTAVTLAVVAIREVRARRRGSPAVGGRAP